MSSKEGGNDGASGDETPDDWASFEAPPPDDPGWSWNDGEGDDVIVQNEDGDQQDEPENARDEPSSDDRNQTGPAPASRDVVVPMDVPAEVVEKIRGKEEALAVLVDSDLPASDIAEELLVIARRGERLR